MRQAAGLRSYWPRWQVTAGTAAALTAGGTAAIAHWPHAWWWLVVVTAAAAAGVPPGIAAITGASQRNREAARITRAALRGVHSGRAGLPRVKDANLATKAHRSVLPIPYIHRDDEDTIRDHLVRHTPVLLVGSSMVGKTRVAVRVITDWFSDWPVVIPDSKIALASLDAADLAPGGCVIWLDDLNELIGADGITSGALQRLARDGNVIVATMRATEYDRFRPTDQLRLPEWDTISTFEAIFLTRNLTKREQERLDEAVSEPGIRNRIRSTGIGEYVGAAGQIAQALQLGEAGVGGVGYALVLGVADWYRCGMKRPVPAALLAQLAKPYVGKRGLARLTDPAALGAGLAWATKEINPKASLLEPVRADAYEIYDYALDLISSNSRSIPDLTWNIAIRHATGAEAFTIGHTAAATYQRPDMAIKALRKAASSKKLAVAPNAATNLGNLLRDEGDTDGAQRAYQQAVDSGTDTAPYAAVNLGDLLRDAGDTDGARRAYQQAIDSDRPGAVATAAVGLGNLLRDAGDTDGARRAYQQAIDADFHLGAGLCAVTLGDLLRDEGDTDGARRAYQQAIDSRLPPTIAKAKQRLRDLALLL